MASSCCLQMRPIFNAIKEEYRSATDGFLMTPKKRDNIFWQFNTNVSPRLSVWQKIAGRLYGMTATATLESYFYNNLYAITLLVNPNAAPHYNCSVNSRPRNY